MIEDGSLAGGIAEAGYYIVFESLAGDEVAPQRATANFSPDGLLQSKYAEAGGELRGRHRASATAGENRYVTGREARGQNHRQVQISGAALQQNNFVRPRGR